MHSELRRVVCTARAAALLQGLWLHSMWMAEEAQVQSESGSLEVRAEARRSLWTVAASGDVRAVV